MPGAVGFVGPRQRVLMWAAIGGIFGVRRARTVGIFPNPATAIRLVGAVLADMHDERQAGDRRCLSEGSMALLFPGGDDGVIAAVDSVEQAPRTTSKPAGRRPARPPEIMEF